MQHRGFQYTDLEPMPHFQKAVERLEACQNEQFRQTLKNFRRMLNPNVKEENDETDGGSDALEVQASLKGLEAQLAMPLRFMLICGTVAITHEQHCKHQPSKGSTNVVIAATAEYVLFFLMLYSVSYCFFMDLKQTCRIKALPEWREWAPTREELQLSNDAGETEVESERSTRLTQIATTIVQRLDALRSKSMKAQPITKDDFFIPAYQSSYCVFRKGGLPEKYSSMYERPPNYVFVDDRVNARLLYVNIVGDVLTLCGRHRHLQFRLLCAPGHDNKFLKKVGFM